jgi:hypothetical protein
VGCYLEYVILQYYRIENNKALEIVNKTDNSLNMSDTFKITTYNIGFGAYNHEFSFFMDSGEMLDGSKVSGTGSKAESKEVVLGKSYGELPIPTKV